MDVTSFITDFDNLPKQIQEQVLDYIDFLKNKYNKKEQDFSEYNKRIQTVSQWSEDDMKYLKEIEINYKWKAEEW